MTKSTTISSDIVFIGAGNVATNLALALHDAGHNIRQVYSRTLESASLLASQLHAEAVVDVAEVVPDADMYIYCLKDDVLGQIPSWQMPFAHGIHLHTSGTCGIEVFREAGCGEYGVFYPFMTFTRDKRAVMNRVSLFLEGSSAVAEARMETLARSLTEHIYIMDSHARARLHLAGVFANNFTNVMLTIADDVAHDAGVDVNVLMPLVQETLDKAAKGNPFANQTGPAIRGDHGTLDAHRRLLANRPAELGIYNLLTEYINSKKKH